MESTSICIVVHIDSHIQVMCCYVIDADRLIEFICTANLFIYFIRVISHCNNMTYFPTKGGCGGINAATMFVLSRRRNSILGRRAALADLGRLWPGSRVADIMKNLIRQYTNLGVLGPFRTDYPNNTLVYTPRCLS